ncbi:MAG: class I SAM-dependent DNA methyltransferase [Roseburia sp.]
MDAYTSFAQVYDMFMDNVPYEKWAHQIQEVLEKENIRDGLILDLGCGTGKLTRLLAESGYDMIGVDNAEDMLMIAREETQEQAGILYLLQDMRNFELYGTVRAVVSVCDCMNYILQEEEILQVFRLVNNYLDPGGLFLFDMNTRYKYEELLAENTFCENREEGSFIWENYYDPESGENEYDLTLFIRQEDGLFEKYEETHVQRAYDLETVKSLLEQAGMIFVTAMDEEGGPVTEHTERMQIIARECGKK